MRYKFKIMTILALALGIVTLVSAKSYAQFSTEVEVKAKLPPATGIKCTISQVTPGADANNDNIPDTLTFVNDSNPATPEVDSFTSFDFGTLVKKTSGVYNSGFYYVCDITNVGGVGGLQSVAFAYDEDAAFEGDLGEHATISLSAVNASVIPNTETLLTHQRLDAAASAGHSVPADFKNRFGRVAVGIANGDYYDNTDNDPLTPLVFNPGATNGECNYKPGPVPTSSADCPQPYTDSSSAGVRQGDLTITVTLL